MALRGAGATRFLLTKSPSSSHTLDSAIHSPYYTRRTHHDVGPLLCRYGKYIHSSSPFRPPGIGRMTSFELLPTWRSRTIARASSLSPEEEMSREIQEHDLQFQISTDDVSGDRDGNSDAVTADREWEPELCKTENPVSPWMDDEETNWPDGVFPANLERKANSADLPVSLRVIKRKMQWNEGFREAGQSAYCSVKTAFSSMVFIIRELHSFTLQMRQLLFYEDLRGILSRVHKEMHASFVWLFQQIFSHTPTLMMYVMILLANFTVYSIGSNDAIAVAATQVGPYSTSIESVSILDIKQTRFDSSSLRSVKLSSSGSRTTSIGGHNGGGRKIRGVATGTGGEEQFPQADDYRCVLPDGASSHLSSLGTSSKKEETVTGREGVDQSITKTRFDLVSPVTAAIEGDNYVDYTATEVSYEKSLSQDPNNPLLLANYAQFLYLVSNDYDRAEDHFKRATAVDPPDAEAYNKYASFLWKARNDLWAAEETFLGAISADPTNSFYAANYAHFLWNTGGEDTCFPLTLHS